MIVTEIYNGQGLGNQLWCYVVTRVIAADKGFKFGIKSPEKFKCLNFLDLDVGEKVSGGSGPEGGPPFELPRGIDNYYLEKKLTHPQKKVDIRLHDPALMAVPDNTKIDGIMQDEQYILHRREQIRDWLTVKKECECFDYASDDLCVINFRGGEYVHIKNVFLPKQYWRDAIKNMKRINRNFKFVVITDDVETAKKFFPQLPVLHFSIGKDFAIIKNAHYLILSNSSFAFFPAWISTNLKFCIAPKFWSQYNSSDGFWGCGYNITQGWMYQDRSGQLADYQTCRRELDQYVRSHQEYFEPQPMVYDIFTFFNELDLLEIRFNILNDHVDRFVIVEARETFSGHPKPLYFEINKARYAKWEHKIIHYVIENIPADETDLRSRLGKKNLDDLDREIIRLNLTSDNIPHGQIHWLKEFYQKENIKNALVNLRDDDRCFISDVDEIWNPSARIDFSRNDIFKLRQFVYSYYLNNRSNEPWAGTLVTKYKNIKNSCLNHLRTVAKTSYNYVNNGGWHFTNQGGLNK